MIGKRVKLVKTEYHDGGGSSLREGDEGTIVDVSILPQRLGGNRQFWIEWDKTGLGTLALIEDEDKFEIMEEKAEKKEEENYSIAARRASQLS